MKDIKNYDLTSHNTFGIKARCLRFVEYATVDELRTVAAELRDAGERPLLLGGGSNLLLTGDYPGTVLHSAVKDMEVSPVEGGYLVRVGSGVVWDELAAHCTACGYYGTENLALIPGEVGASAVQNIGAYGVEAKDIIHKVEAMDLETGRMVEFANEDCDYAYRHSRFKDAGNGHFAITHVTYKLSSSFAPKLDYGNIRAALEAGGVATPTAQQLRDAIVKTRRAKLPDPAELGNAGSFFMNPVVSRARYEALADRYPAMPHYDMGPDAVKIPAGWLIEQSGWKGKSLGKAGVYERQALVLVNLGGAEGLDIVRLCKAVQYDVKEKFGISIHPEVNIR